MYCRNDMLRNFSAGTIGPILFALRALHAQNMSTDIICRCIYSICIYERVKSLRFYNYA